MARGKIKAVRVHLVPTADFSDRVGNRNELYIDYIKRKMECEHLSFTQKITVIDGIIAQLKAGGT